MKIDVDKVKLLYSELGIDERKEVREFIQEYEGKFYDEKKRLNEDLRKSLGPLSSAKCAYCGK
ncbi:hypothetical protein SYJ56_04765 [Algoriphagus sp. D3-2-R+10]|uniref:hypothetical protein n=1 Tax=Algoriphagus aurantiacus TaxID=3103948 RepID=UPI002B3CDDA5|nr:hypothetical protein [Algoriphagus sp. D3-2-R+10]MEB2774605.1 hypothetical protein [Algoriphagus sp. D3-2-R+10]